MHPAPRALRSAAVAVVLLAAAVSCAPQPEESGEPSPSAGSTCEKGELATRTSGKLTIADQVCFLEGGVVLERGTAEQVFGDPRQERTRRFLRRIVEAGRRGGCRKRAGL
ncbi:hypothetical protein A4E84_10015 [Streptomyces qaidamensis]|uniref:Uncharacterized protein n=1 Tax=Streptomyces qaidamensis TaxID=1783515 RepID=A0A143BXD1_9ACTN|nr:hypothetical protein [Streptomyces qaidamensis]AMW09813.1 hypothetical protein A4E84_10015 [Streptomyces qaidamensis]